MQDKNKNPVSLIIAGPTASGKSCLAMALAEKKQGCIINADSMQVYKSFPILTAQPTPAEIKNCPHKLYGYISPPTLSSAASWAEDAKQEIENSFISNHLPILVGGTGLYLEFSIFGAAEIPDIPDAIRQKAQKDYAENPEHVFAFIQKHDPVLAARINANDKQRTIRAYEVFLTTGKALSDFHTQENAARLLTHQPAFIFILPNREKLYANINSRFQKMVKEGALGEAMQGDSLAEDHPALKAVGVLELLAFHKGQCSLEEAILKSQTISRNYAKRQYTWFRNRLMPKAKEAGFSLLLLESSDFTENLDKSLNFIGKLG